MPTATDDCGGSIVRGQGLVPFKGHLRGGMPTATDDCGGSIVRGQELVPVRQAECRLLHGPNGQALTAE